ncbi:hypothetical protein S141_32 [Shewanella sp. phage 1/41]|nr:hypothetical protein S141_32 [Shewanella sp. phage 1/41]AHK11678.1 hypothetical protein S141_32 [Shewanella sp. phage 1/41]
MQRCVIKVDIKAIARYCCFDFNNGN